MRKELPHVVSEPYKLGYDEFSKNSYDWLRTFVEQMEEAEHFDFSDILMNHQGIPDLIPDENAPEDSLPHVLVGKVAIADYIGRYTITGWIDEKADDDRLQEMVDDDVVGHLEDAYMSWEAGALDAIEA